MTERARWFVHRAVADAALACGVVPRALMAETRIRRVTRARKLAYWIARETSGCTWVDLAGAFGKDHSTLVYGAGDVERELAAGDVDTISLVQAVLDANRSLREWALRQLPVDPRDHFAELRSRLYRNFPLPEAP